MLAKYSYNKSTIQQFQKQLNIRAKALPVLLRKETALRQVIVKRKQALAERAQQLEALRSELDALDPVAYALRNAVVIAEIKRETENVAGTKVQKLVAVEFAPLDFDFRYAEGWAAPAIAKLRHYLAERLSWEQEQAALQSLEKARKKTTQKVNLYEKVQIPAYEEAIRKIKSFLEDKENIATAAAKIVKNRKAEAL